MDDAAEPAAEPSENAGEAEGSLCFDFERGWLETHTLRELLEFAVGEFDSNMVLRAGANISANCVQHVDVMTASRRKRRQPQDKYDISRMLEKEAWKVMHDVPTDNFTFDMELQGG
eukprot:jgi/Tetstr1/461782/TSEL_006869.t1